MKFSKSFFLPLVALLALAGCNNSDIDKDGVYAIYDNAVIYTSEEASPKAQALVVQDDKLVYVGSSKEARKYKNASSTLVDMKGKTILPGIVESHVHPGMSGFLLSAGMVALADMNLAEVQAALRKYLSDNPTAELIVGMGFNLKLFGLGEGKYPTSRDLDVVTTDIPVLLFDDGCHSSWCNNKALTMARVDKNTPDPKPGVDVFIRDEDGNPTGYMLEKAFFVVAEATPLFNLEKVTGGIGDLLDKFTSLGVTSICDPGGLFDIEYDALTNLQNDGRLNFHYQKANIAIEDDPAASLKKLKELDAKYTKGNLRCNLYKALMDGTIEVETAALIDPYTSSGKVAKGYITAEQAIAHATTALSAGYAIHVHAIGDKAQRDILDAYLATQSINPHLTRAIAHNQVFEPNALEKYKKMKSNLTCQSTANWAHPDAVEITKEKIGEERFQRQYLWGELMAEGVNVAFGCDLPANVEEAISPFVQIWCAVMRKTDAAFFPPREAGLSVQQAIQACTINGARQMMIEDLTGSLKKGKSADFIVIDRDITLVNPQDIATTKVEQTYFQGKRVH